MKFYLLQLETVPGIVELRAHGTMGESEAQFIVARCASLPDSVHSVRVDLTLLESLEPSALGAIRAFATRWSARRTGDASVEFCANAMRTSLRTMARRRELSVLSARGESNPVASLMSIL